MFRPIQPCEQPWKVLLFELKDLVVTPKAADIEVTLKLVIAVFQGIVITLATGCLAELS